MTCTAEAFRTRPEAEAALARAVARLKNSGGDPHVWAQLHVHRCQRCGRWHYRHQKPMHKTVWQPAPGAIQKANPS